MHSRGGGAGFTAGAQSFMWTRRPSVLNRPAIPRESEIRVRSPLPSAQPIHTVTWACRARVSFRPAELLQGLIPLMRQTQARWHGVMPIRYWEVPDHEYSNTSLRMLCQIQVLAVP